jgi:hypothetical protein
MAKALARHQHREWKTLIVLVIAMAAMTCVLWVVASWSPITPLRGRSGGGLRPWTKISVCKTAAPVGNDNFYHFRIDETGRLYQSSAWNEGRCQQAHAGSVRIVLSHSDKRDIVTRSQQQTLSRTIARLCDAYGISADAIEVE